MKLYLGFRPPDCDLFVAAMQSTFRHSCFTIWLLFEFYPIYQHLAIFSVIHFRLPNITYLTLARVEHSFSLSTRCIIPYAQKQELSVYLSYQKIRLPAVPADISDQHPVSIIFPRLKARFWVPPALPTKQPRQIRNGGCSHPSLAQRQSHLCLSTIVL